MKIKSLGISKYMAGLVLAISFPACADFSGRVVSIADGDTITVLVERQQVKVRLVEIDTPEKAQAFGAKAKQALGDMVFGKDVAVEEHGKDRYARTLGRVMVNGQDANAEMVRQGYAWVYRKYSLNPDLLRLEFEAREAKRGLWVDPEPVPPWEWRHR
ncbi:MAG: thermonuclease family protein [Thiobacillus sp.]|nr:thermonuclease family protein [Thiobacillus sp.]